MLQEKHAHGALSEGRGLRSSQKARLLLGLAASVVFGLGGYLSATTQNGQQPLTALGLQTALFPAAAPAPAAPVAAAPAPADTTVPAVPANVQGEAPAPVAAPAPLPAAAPAAAAAPARPAPADAPAAPRRDERADASEGAFFQQGHSSYYAHELAGRPTASGERFNPEGLTAAHKTLPLGTRIRVTSVTSGRSVVVRVNDRGPFVRGRILDLSLGAARAIGLHRSGGGQVRIHVLGRGARRAATVEAPEPPAEQVATRRARRAAPAAAETTAPRRGEAAETAQPDTTG